VATGLNFPTGVAFDNDGRAYVTESGYSYGEVWTTPRLVRVEANGQLSEVARGDHGPWNGVDFSPRDATFYVAQGGEEGGGRIVRITLDGKITPVIENLPASAITIPTARRVGPTGRSTSAREPQPTAAWWARMMRSFGWLKRHPDFHDIPARDIKLVGQNFQTNNPIGGAKPRQARSCRSAPRRKPDRSSPASAMYRGDHARGAEWR
jgi:hypothetical protein